MRSATDFAIPLLGTGFGRAALVPSAKIRRVFRHWKLLLASWAGPLDTINFTQSAQSGALGEVNVYVCC